MNGLQPHLTRLPLATLYLTERCNSRCVTCDYWRHGRDSLTLESVEALLPDLKRMRTETVLLSGGEPMLHPQWQQIAAAIRANGQKSWLLTSGLSLFKNAQAAARLFDAITVSLDGTDAPTYQAIRGLDAFDAVCRGIRASSEAGLAPGIRVTLQRANFHQLLDFVDLAQTLKAREVSFLAVDVANSHAFGRGAQFERDAVLRPQDLAIFEALLARLEKDRAAAFGSGFLVQSPRKMRDILQYFTALTGQGDFPQVRCNAPEFSAVLDARRNLSPCFFIPGNEAAAGDGGISRALNSNSMIDLRASIRAGERKECARCVCSLWRDPTTFREHDA